MLDDMKEQTKKQQAQSNHNWKQVTLDQKGAVNEQEALK